MTAQIMVRGVLVREPDPILQSYEELAQIIDEQLAAGEDIVLDFDCHGGEAIGVKALADKIYSNRDKITAYVSGYCASAAYYLAAACSRITAAEDAIIGSVGAIAWPPDIGDAKVATLSPLKNSGDDLQAIVDDSCERFLVDVARYRGIAGTVEEIAEKVGSGALMTAREAMNHNLIDEVRMDDQVDRGELDEAGMASVIDQMARRLDEMDAKLASADERIGLLEERLDALKAETEPEGDVSEECRPQAADGEEPDLPAEDKEDEKKDEIMECLFSAYKREGKIPAREEAGARRLMNSDFSLFREIYEGRTTAPTRLSMSAKTKAPAGRTRDERARQYMQTAGCSYAAALAHEMEKEMKR